MSEPIKVGDLVVVVRGHRCGLGEVFTVDEIAPEDERGMKCTVCGAALDEKIGTPLAKAGTIYRAIWRLRRIPPLWELDEAEHRESIEA